MRAAEAVLPYENIAHLPALETTLGPENLQPGQSEGEKYFARHPLGTCFGVKHGMDFGRKFGVGRNVRFEEGESFGIRFVATRKLRADEEPKPGD